MARPLPISDAFTSPFSRSSKRLLSRIAVLLTFVFAINSLLPLAARAGEPGGPPDTTTGPNPVTDGTDPIDTPCADNPLGSSGCDPVDLSSGNESYGTINDLSVYNPNGPSTSFSRTFFSGRAKDGYGSPGLSPGWTHQYDITIQRALKVTTYTAPPGSPPGTPVSPPTYSLEDPKLISANGSSEALGIASSPFFVTYGTVSGTGTSETYSFFTVTRKDGTKWTFTPATPFYYVLSRITNKTGQSIDLSWDSSQRLTSITDTTTSTTLLTLSYDTNGQLEKIVDVYGRKVAYTFGVPSGSGLTLLSLLEVSQIVASSVSSPPVHYSLGYVGYVGQPLLHTITVPSPTGTGTSTATINYDNGPGGTGKVTSLVDANGNQHVYTYNSGNTLVEVKDPSNNVVQSWITNFNAEGRVTGSTDANYHSDYIDYGDPANPAKPTQIIAKDGLSTTMAYDSHGNMISRTDPRGVITT